MRSVNLLLLRNQGGANREAAVFAVTRNWRPALCTANGEFLGRAKQIS
jgi:hypothetical protein